MRKPISFRDAYPVNRVGSFSNLTSHYEPLSAKPLSAKPLAVKPLAAKPLAAITRKQPKRQQQEYVEESEGETSTESNRRLMKEKKTLDRLVATAKRQNHDQQKVVRQNSVIRQIRDRQSSSSSNQKHSLPRMSSRHNPELGSKQRVRPSAIKNPRIQLESSNKQEQKVSQESFFKQQSGRRYRSINQEQTRQQQPSINQQPSVIRHLRELEMRVHPNDDQKPDNVSDRSMGQQKSMIQQLRERESSRKYDLNAQKQQPHPNREVHRQSSGSTAHQQKSTKHPPTSQQPRYNDQKQNQSTRQRLVPEKEIKKHRVSKSSSDDDMSRQKSPSQELTEQNVRNKREKVPLVNDREPFKLLKIETIDSDLPMRESRNRIDSNEQKQSPRQMFGSDKQLRKHPVSSRGSPDHRDESQQQSASRDLRDQKANLASSQRRNPGQEFLTMPTSHVNISASHVAGRPVLKQSAIHHSSAHYQLPSKIKRERVPNEESKFIRTETVDSDPTTTTTVGMNSSGTSPNSGRRKEYERLPLTHSPQSRQKRENSNGTTDNRKKRIVLAVSISLVACLSICGAVVASVLIFVVPRANTAPAPTIAPTLQTKTSEPTPSPPTNPDSFSNKTWAQFGPDIMGFNDGDQTGLSVSISGTGSRLAIGAPYNSNNGRNSGIVSIYENQISSNSETNWVNIASILGSMPNDNFGFSISLSPDGNRIAISSPGHGMNDTKVGKVQVYEDKGQSNWIQVGDDIESEREGRFFGMSVSVSLDGKKLAIGAPYENEYQGSVRVFEDIAGKWTLLGSALNGNTVDDHFGWSVSLSYDGTFAVVGAPNHAKGHVRMFEYRNEKWNPIGEINGKSVGDQFGKSVSLAKDGKRVAIGGPGNDSYGTNSGFASVYELAGLNWIKLGGDLYGENKDEFGSSVSLSTNGNRISIGAPKHPKNGLASGQVSIYEFDNVTWVRSESVHGDNAGDLLGASVSMSEDGSFVAVGVPQANVTQPNGTGFVRVFS